MDATPAALDAIQLASQIAGLSEAHQASCVALAAAAAATSSSSSGIIATTATGSGDCLELDLDRADAATLLRLTEYARDCARGELDARRRARDAARQAADRLKRNRAGDDDEGGAAF
ncbi:hypothetical protein HK405_006207 [Cladochytrium tenue]|nr:hypothetical protein HK405_006207 [Cladochytrium tenue]